MGTLKIRDCLKNFILLGNGDLLVMTERGGCLSKLCISKSALLTSDADVSPAQVVVRDFLCPYPLGDSL